MNQEEPHATTVVCVGGRPETVRGVCARVRKSGYRAIGVITEVNPACTLPLLSKLSPDAIILSNDLPNSDGRVFSESVQRMHPDVRILLLAEDHDPAASVSSVNSGSIMDRNTDIAAKLSALFKAHA